MRYPPSPQLGPPFISPPSVYWNLEVEVKTRVACIPNEYRGPLEWEYD